MADTYTTSAKTSANASTEGKLDLDVSSTLWHVGEPSEFPLFTLIGGKAYSDGKSQPKDVKGRVKKETATEIKYSVVEKNALSRTLTVATAVADTTTTTLVLSSNARCTVGDLIRNTRTGECCLVYAVDSGGANLSIRRNLGSTAYTILKGDTFKIYSYAQKAGGSKRTLQSVIGSNRDRYVQIFKRSWAVTDTLANIKLKVDTDDWSEEMTQALVEHKRDMEYAFWMNPAADSSTDSGSSAVYLTRGIIAELSSYTTDCDGTLDEDKFFGEVSEDIFEYGPQKKAFFVDAKMKTRILSWARVKQQLRPKDNVYGLDITELYTGHGVLEMVSCGVFGQLMDSSEQGYGVVLDLDNVKVKTIANRDTKLQTGIETPGDDAKEGQYITEAGLCLTLLPHHRVIKNIG